jgi:hypothetical protein
MTSAKCCRWKYVYLVFCHWCIWGIAGGAHLSESLQGALKRLLYLPQVSGTLRGTDDWKDGAELCAVLGMVLLTCIAVLTDENPQMRLSQLLST